ncbi:hypothetical protein R3P38DRAFT_2902354, partial [Favolaschia claudopus]
RKPSHRIPSFSRSLQLIQSICCGFNCLPSINDNHLPCFRRCYETCAPVPNRRYRASSFLRSFVLPMLMLLDSPLPSGIAFDSDSHSSSGPPRRRSDFQCPDADKDGSRLTGQGVSSNTSNGHGGATSTTTFSCTYSRGGAGQCDYDGDGIFMSGSSACPDGTEGTNDSGTLVAPDPTSASGETSTTFPLPSPPQSSPPISPSSGPPFSSTKSAAVVPSSINAPVESTSGSSTLPFLPSETGPLQNEGITRSRCRPGSTLSSATIAGILISVFLSLLFITLLLLYLRRRRRNQHAADSALAPKSFLIPAHGQVSMPNEGNAIRRLFSTYKSKGRSPVASSLSDGGDTATAAASQSTSTRSHRQEALTAQLHAVQKELEALRARAGDAGEGGSNLAAQNEALRERIRMLEHERMGLQGEAPPAYMES